MGTTWRVPAFMKGVAQNDRRPGPHMQAGVVIRPVAWAKPGVEVAEPLPMQRLTPPHPDATAPIPSHLQPTAHEPPPGFERLDAQPPPTPAPLPPPLAIPPPAPAPVVAAPPELSPRVEAAIQALKAQGERLAEQARSDALEIGMLVARKILEREVSTNVDALFALVKSAIRRAGDARGAVVHLCPTDHDRLHESAESAFTLGKVTLVADEALSPGDVVVEAAGTTVDGKMSTRLDALRRELSHTLDEE